mmetsp:Transcript_19238/g.17057  ORF Transcript_19238/g.17057 Transcript_19238/m.17057 type:complete len:111 (+) Transcript_19238:570-902(+)
MVTTRLHISLVYFSKNDFMKLIYSSSHLKDISLIKCILDTEELEFDSKINFKIERLNFGTSLTQTSFSEIITAVSTCNLKKSLKQIVALGVDEGFVIEEVEINGLSLKVL